MEIKRSSLHQWVEETNDGPFPKGPLDLNVVPILASATYRQNTVERCAAWTTGNFHTFKARLGAHAKAEDSRQTSSRVRCLPWINISVALCLSDALISLLIGPVAFEDLSSAGVHSICWTPLIAAPLLTVGLLFERGFYSRSEVLRSVSVFRLLAASLQTSGLLLAVAAILQVGLSWKQIPSHMVAVMAARGHGSQILLLLAGGAGGLLIPRLLWSAVRRRLSGSSGLVHGRALIVGTGEAIREAIDRLTHTSGLEFEIVGFLCDGASEDLLDYCIDEPSLGRMGDLTSTVRQHGADTVIIALPWREQERISKVIAEASRLPVSLRLMLDGSVGSILKSQPLAASYEQHFLLMRDAPISGFKAVSKRAEDLVLALLLLIALAPVLVLIAIAIKLESVGPVFFFQRRQGFNGKVFKLCKFRSMHTNMTDHTSDRQTSRADPRVTRVGALIRRHSLDELPQLFNVIRGDMSVVGPRPHALGTRTKGVLLDEAVEAYVARCQVKPGITGWAQVNGWRGELNTMEKLECRVQHDLEYIENWSLSLDFKVLAKTCGCVLYDSNAY